MHDTTGRCDHAFTRRAFLSRGLTLASLAATAPVFLERSAAAMALPLGSALSSRPGVPEDRVLVVVQLGGGNDGLNTVVPYGHDAYYQRRPQLAITAPGRGGGQNQAVLPVDDRAGIGLNPALRGFKELLDDGVASIVQGVGYPNPNRSHFTSMDIWHTADTRGNGHGWIGRYFDHECAGRPDRNGVAIGRTAPLAMIGGQHTPVSFESAEMFRWVGSQLSASLDDPYQAINRGGALANVDGESQLGFLMRTALDAQVSSDRIRAAVAKRPEVDYPRTPLAQQLQLVGAMIRDELPTRVYYVSLGGFDTHANQAGQHARLLAQVGGALNAFYKDIKKQGNSGRVLTMMFSEFGRRVAQNASGGTDHGTAAPMYLVGDMVRPGLLGEHPSLTNLDNGDLRYTVDFRSIYAGILGGWMGADSAKILGKAYPAAKILA